MCCVWSIGNCIHIYVLYLVYVSCLLCAVSGLLVIAFIFICYVWFMLVAYLCAMSGLC